MGERLWRDEAGAQSLEFVALIPLVILVLLTMLQTAFLAYAVVVAETSAREAALAATRAPAVTKSTAEQAAKKAAGGLGVAVTSIACTNGDVTVVLTATVPNLLFDKAMTLSRTVTMPRQEGSCP